ncbi:Rop-like protein [Alteromonadaceae bacterium 2753L.S.0a.02]|nr:Rop-like protein [Alteromonadaceae bacterium 2753L.S.0a.02]
MTEEELKALNKDAKKKKRIATDWASQIHDVVEDTLWTDYERLTELAASTIAACEEWKVAQAKLDEASA